MDRNSTFDFFKLEGFFSTYFSKKFNFDQLINHLNKIRLTLVLIVPEAEKFLKITILEKKEASKKIKTHIWQKISINIFPKRVFPILEIFMIMQ